MKILNTILLFILFIASCKEPTEVDDNYLREIIDQYNMIKPLKAGYFWKYDFYRYNSQGKEIFSATKEEVVLSDTIFSDQRWYFTTKNKDILQTNYADGLHFREYKKDDSFIEWVEAKFPAKTGFSWISKNITYKVINADTVINVPAGYFHCIYYHGNEYDPDKKLWKTHEIFYSKGIGLIRSGMTERKDDSTSESSLQELKEYRLE